MIILVIHNGPLKTFFLGFIGYLNYVYLIIQIICIFSNKYMDISHNFQDI